jgi:long-chain acyl-CoA synthetase
VNAFANNWGKGEGATVNLFARFEAVALRQPDRPALQQREETGYRRLTYGEVARQARALAAALVKAGVTPGDRVALISENRPEWTIAYLGVMAAGATAVPLDVQMGDGELANVFEHAACRMAIASAKQAPRLLSLDGRDSGRLGLVELDAEVSRDRALSLPAVLRDFDPAAPPSLPVVGPEALASILYTSGTTGTPKGVMLTHGNFLANAQSVLDFGLINAQDIVLGLLPLHHAFPFILQLIILFAGGRLIFSGSLKGPDLLACMRETGVTILVGVPQLFYLLHKGIFDEVERRPLLVRLLFRRLLRLSGALRPRGINLGRRVFGQVHRRFGGRIRIMASGGARLDPAIARDLLALGFAFTEGYGLTETSPVVSFNPLDRVRPGSVGVPLPGVEVCIVGPDAEGVGEIAIRGPNVMQGYYRNPEATARVMREGWFLSGDLGFLDADGYLTVTGRAKEVIVLSSGKNIYPEEVEHEYLKSPYIKEICLVPHTSDRAGAQVEGLLALVLPDLDYFRAHGMTNLFETIRWDMENVGRSLPPYKRPTGLRIVKEGFPRTALGKIQRHLVLQRFVAQPAEEEVARETALPTDEDAALLEDEVGRKVVEYLQEATKRPEVSLDDHLELDLGMDSLARVEMLVALEEMFQVEIPDEAAAECFMVREVIERLHTLRGGEIGSLAASRRRGWRHILMSPPPPEVRELVEASSRPSATAITALSRALCAALFRTAYRLEVAGLQQVPRQGPLILVANHCSFYDAFILAASLPLRVAQQVFYMGFEWFFRHPIVAWWGRGVRVIPVDMDTYLVRALQTSALILQRGKILCLFPEGERSASGRLRPFRKGVGILIRELKVPVLPAFISGSFEAWPRGQTFPGIHRLHVRFGPVVTADELLGAGETPGADEYATIVTRLQERVAALGRDSTDIGPQSPQRAQHRI